MAKNVYTNIRNTTDLRNWCTTYKCERSQPKKLIAIDRFGH